MMKIEICWIFFKIVDPDFSNILTVIEYFLENFYWDRDFVNKLIKIYIFLWYESNGKFR